MFKLSIIFKFFVVTCMLQSYILYADILKTENSERIAFEKAYKEFWGNNSGLGSEPLHAKSYLILLQHYLNDININNIVDLGCGDWRLMKTLNIPGNKQYKGFDLVESVIQNNIKKYSNNHIKFFLINNISDIYEEKGDLLIVKDVLQHWPLEQTQLFINNILPNFKYVLLTHDYSSTSSNCDISHGYFTTIDLEAEPFNLRHNLEILMDYPAHGIVKRVYLYTNLGLVKTP